MAQAFFFATHKIGPCGAFLRALPLDIVAFRPNGGWAGERPVRVFAQHTPLMGSPQGIGTTVRRGRRGAFCRCGCCIVACPLYLSCQWKYIVRGYVFRTGCLLWRASGGRCVICQTLVSVVDNDVCRDCFLLDIFVGKGRRRGWDVLYSFRRVGRDTGCFRWSSPLDLS